MKRRNELGELRRTAVVSTFGPGSIVDFRAGDAPVSGVVAGLEEWDSRARPAGLANPQTVFEPRLQKQLGVRGFRLPPVYPDEDAGSGALVAARFPLWLQCPQCQIIKPASRWNQDPGRAGRKCGTCTSRSPGGRPVFVVPVRFVCSCEAGHLDDFPWHLWVNHRPDCKQNDNAVLKLSTESAGLAGLILRCLSCRASRSMDGVFSGKALGGLRCRGLRPWLACGPEDCARPPRVLQRGASNLYFPVIRSALDIPPWSDHVQRVMGQYWGPITNIPAREDREKFVAIILPQLGLEMSQEALVQQVEQRLRILESVDVENLRWDEYLQFASGEATPPESDTEFEIRPESVPGILAPFLERIVRAVRLREVRAISGFSRIHPPNGNSPDDQLFRIAPIQLKRHNWLPAVEVRGEGIFLSLNRERLSEWESQTKVRASADILDRRYRAAWGERYGGESAPDRVVTPRLILIHTLAHVLIRELALECGYSSASLRERLYVGEDPTEMAGLLIYTASPDSDGTLGGLVRQGTAGRLEILIRKAVTGSRWCSSDPLCMAGLTSASESMNLAACHSCVLASETSCEEYNQFLDRGALMDADTGFFRNMV